MKILHGRWVNDYEEPLSVFEIKHLLSLGEKVISLFGKDITYDRIDIVNSLSTDNKNENKEKIINHLLKNERLLNKLI
jgi:hypothetical protein